MQQRCRQRCSRGAGSGAGRGARTSTALAQMTSESVRIRSSSSACRALSASVPSRLGFAGASSPSSGAVEHASDMDGECSRSWEVRSDEPGAPRWHSLCLATGSAHSLRSMLRRDTCGAWRNTTAAEAASWHACPLWNNTVVEPMELARFRCDLHASPNQLRRWHSCEPSHASHRTIARNATLFFVGDSLAQQAAKAMACMLTTQSHTRKRTLTVAPQASWYGEVNPRMRPHQERGPPFCVGVSDFDGAHTRICFVTAWPTAFDLATLLVEKRIARPGDVICVNERMERGANAALQSMQRFAAAVNNASNPLGRGLREGVHFLWREKSPQTFSDSPVGAFQHATYGSSQQQCGVPLQVGRSAAVAKGLAELEAVGVGVVRIWELTVTQADQFLSRRTPYVSRRLDCTHLCEPSGVLHAWSTVTLAALARVVLEVELGMAGKATKS